MGTGDASDAENKETDGTGSEDRDTVDGAYFTEVNGLNCDTKRFEECAGFSLDLIGQREAIERGNDELFAQGAVVGGLAEELVIGTKVGVAFAAVFAVTTGIGGFDGYAVAGGKECAGFSAGIRPGSDDGASEFVPHAKGSFCDMASDATGLIYG